MYHSQRLHHDSRQTLNADHAAGGCSNASKATMAAHRALAQVPAKDGAETEEMARAHDVVAVAALCAQDGGAGGYDGAVASLAPWVAASATLVDAAGVRGGAEDTSRRLGKDGSSSSGGGMGGGAEAERLEGGDAAGDGAAGSLSAAALVTPEGSGIEKRACKRFVCVCVLKRCAASIQSLDPQPCRDSRLGT